jgi:squalene-hopene/tetraprenyl-beta-curcumene cyclase
MASTVSPVQSPDSASRLLVQELLEQRTLRGEWTGHLSSSALATATAVSAFSVCRSGLLWPGISRARMDELISGGLAWCAKHQNADGGWGDTTCNHSNIATTLLTIAAFRLSGETGPSVESTLAKADSWCQSAAGTSALNGDPLRLVASLEKRYGEDKTFAVPILANCAIAGLVPWDLVPPLPCEAALVSQSLFRFFRLPVVSYAIPALVAIGQARFLAAPPRNPITRFLRKLSIRPGLTLLENMQPASGGYLEAVPLTAFVVMSLATSGRANNPVVQHGLLFLDSLFRDEGNGGTWPIDSNLATWVTTLAVNAMTTSATAGSGSDALRFQNDVQDTVLTDSLLNWLLSCQNKTVHPFTGSSPGGWGWTDLTGSVPDADDTPGALLALRAWLHRPGLRSDQTDQILSAGRQGIHWLLDLQNRDGGWPTFCRGWGRMPFDRSGPDISAHVIRSLQSWKGESSLSQLLPRIDKAIDRGFRYLEKTQHPDGSWTPLWFGNQDDPKEENPIYGTSRVLLAWVTAGRANVQAAERGVEWLTGNQRPNGSWGGASSHRSGNRYSAIVLEDEGSVQETALAVQALASFSSGSGENHEVKKCVELAQKWLVQAVHDGKHHENWPIGFYFSRLWYHERLYPVIFSLAACRELAACEK